MKDKVLLLAINARYSHSNLALFYLKQILQEQNLWDLELIECTIKERSEDILQKILLYPQKPKYVILSIYIWNSILGKELSRNLKALASDITLILGGPEVSYNMDLWENHCPADYLVQGPGEPVIQDILLGKHPKGRVLSPGIPLDEVPFPYDQQDLQLLKNRMVYYETSRGCPYRCSYCLSSCEDQPLQFRDLDRVKDELKILAFSGARVIKLVDRSFNAKPSRAREIWKYLIDMNGPVPFHCEIHPLLLQEEDFRLLSQAPAHLFHFEIGVQTTDSAELERIHRKGDWSRIGEKIQRLLKETQIPIHLDQIVALPGADFSSVRRSFNHILSLKPQEFQMGFLKVLPGTPLEREYGSTLVSSAVPPYQVLQTPTLSFGEIAYLHRIERLVNSYYNSEQFFNSLALLLSSPYPYGEAPFSFFQQLADYLDRVGGELPRQWAKLGELLLNWFSQAHPSGIASLKDALRMDWAPLSQGQYIPGFINYPNPKHIMELRHGIKEQCYSQGVTAQQFKRSILIKLESWETPRSLLYIPMGKERRVLEFPL